MKTIGSTVVAGLLLLATAAAAQDAPSTTTFGIYYRCNQALEAQADEAVLGTLGAIAQRHVDSGALTNWIWLTHRQGGEWRRVFVTIGTDLAGMMETRDQIEQEFLEGHPEEAAALNSACPSHDDYIWQSVATSAAAGTTPAGPASISTYHICDRSREGRADEIFAQVIAPLYERHRGMGHIASWTYSAHRMGGFFRRLETFSGSDHMTLLNLQDAIFNEATTSNPLAMREFSEICSVHTDYMWEVGTQQ